MAKENESRDYFWTDHQQASERLTHSVILYDDQPVYVMAIEAHEDGIPRAHILSCADVNTNPSAAVRKKLNSPKFKRFRELPRIGWMNCSIGPAAVFLSRVPRVSRLHGLVDGGVSVQGFIDHNGQTLLQGQPAGRSFRHFHGDTGFTDAHNDRFPSLEKTLEKIKESSSIAVSRKLCVCRDQDGICWLYRNTDRIGIFSEGALYLLRKHSFLREELMADPVLTVNTIREF